MPQDLAARARMARLRQTMFGVAMQPPQVDRFVLLEKFGEGGMGVVYAAQDPRLERRIALKLVHAERGSGPRGEARLLREAKAMARLSHPNVVQIHEVVEWEGRVFIAMELVRGRTLAAWLAQSSRGWREVVAVFTAAGRGLAAAHAAGVVHRDFKPENVLVGEDGHVRVTDFGLAIGLRSTDDGTTSEAAASDGTTRSSSSGAFAGTPAYMAPELFLGRPATAASDQFSFCVALYHALHGVRLFAGDERAALIQSVIVGRRVEPQRSNVPRQIHRALVRGLASVPEKRFPTLDALLAASEPRGARGAWLAAGGALVWLGLAVVLLSEQWLRPPSNAVSTVPCVLCRMRFAVANAEATYRVPPGCTTVRVQAWGGGGVGRWPPVGQAATRRRHSRWCPNRSS
ncbi:MAG: serine/threonine protein kinase [Myxococcales bacterium]|nr:serine/threonine protein kinase [Myxococcales bacterium]